MLGAIAEAARNMKNEDRTGEWLEKLVTVYTAVSISRTPSRSPETSPRHDKGKGVSGSSSTYKTRAQIFAELGLIDSSAAQEPSSDKDECEIKSSQEVGI